MLHVDAFLFFTCGIDDVIKVYGPLHFAQIGLDLGAGEGGGGGGGREMEREERGREALIVMEV